MKTEKESAKNTWLCGLVLVILLFVAFGTLSQAQAAGKSKQRQTKERYAALILDAQSGRILYQENDTAQRYPASLTKMMTLYMTFQALEAGALRLDTFLPVSANAASQAPTKLGLRAGGRIKVHDAILGLVIESANDASVVLAEAMGGNTRHFAQMMTEQARALGMRGTVFKNPNGLPDNQQVTTARDIAVLSYALIYHYPGFYPYFSRQEFVFNGQRFDNHNHLMETYPGMDGLKTGFIRASGFNLAASAERNGRRLIGVVFGGRSAKSRDQQMARLLDDAFDQLRRGQDQGGRYVSLPSKVATAFGSGSALASNDVPVEEEVVEEHEAPPQPRQTLRPPKPPRRPAAKAPSSGEESKGWGIQVGAYSEILSARNAMASLLQSTGPALENAEPSIQKLTMTDGTTVYRARFMGMDRDTARSVCSHIVKHGQGCLVVSGP